MTLWMPNETATRENAVQQLVSNHLGSAEYVLRHLLVDKPEVIPR